MSADNDRNRPAAETVYLELSDSQSHKFYEVTVNGTAVTVRYGRIGAPGQSSDSTYATPEKAQAEATKKINEKLRKGYTRIRTEDDRPTSSEELPDPATSPTSDEVSSRTIDLAKLPIETSGSRSVLKLPLQRSLVAVEVIAICNQPTFTINLRIGSNIAYHFDVRSHQRQIVQNTCITGGWGAEERLPIPVEFTSDQPFTLRIAVEQTMVVYLNGQVLSRYGHRLPPTQISTVEISYPSGNLQVQSMQVFEQVEGEIAEPTDNFPGAARGNSAQNQEPTSLPNSTPSLPVIDPTIPFRSGELLHKAVRGPTFLPRIIQNHLPAVRYPLGFVFFERQGYDLTIPLARSLVCFEMVGTLVNMDSGGFTLYLAANHEAYYHCEFRPHEGHIKHWVRVRGESSPPEPISIPNTIAPGQIFHYVLTMTESTVVAYLNNHSVFHHPRPQPSDPLDTLHLNYNPSGLRLQLARVLEPIKDEMWAAHPGEAIATPVSPSPQTTATQASPLLETLPSQFEPLRPYIEAKLQSYIKIHVGEQAQWLDSAWSGDPLEPWQSKIGGFPYLPKGTAYPTDRETGELMLFLMQINCADLPIIDGLPLPRQGILQFYSGLNVPMCEVSPEQHRILYFPEISQDKNDLITDFGFLVEYAEIEEWYHEIYPLTFSAHQDLFRVTRAGYTESLKVPEELETLSEEFMAWLDEEDDQETIDRRVNKLGGEVEFHSYVDETVGEAEGSLLLELNHPCDCDDYFYFFIEAENLADLDFSNVESYFMRV